MNPNKYYEFNYNGEQYIVPREWIEEHRKQIRAEAFDECIEALEELGCAENGDEIWTLEQLKEQK